MTIRGKFIGVCNSTEEKVATILSSLGLEYSVFKLGKTSKKSIIVVRGLDYFLLAYDKYKGERIFLVLDNLALFNGVGMPIVGMSPVSPGKYAKSNLPVGLRDRLEILRRSSRRDVELIDTAIHRVTRKIADRLLLKHKAE